ELRRFDFARERVAVANGDEGRAIEKLRADVRDAQQQIAIAERLIVGDGDSAEKKIAARDRRRQRLDVFTTEMHADGDVLHRLLTRATASHARLSSTARSISPTSSSSAACDARFFSSSSFLRSRNAFPGGAVSISFCSARKLSTRVTSVSLQRCGSISTRNVHSCFPPRRSSALFSIDAFSCRYERSASSLLNSVNARSGMIAVFFITS